MFFETVPDLEEHTDTVPFYINSCIRNVTVEKTIKKYTNQK